MHLTRHSCTRHGAAVAAVSVAAAALVALTPDPAEADGSFGWATCGTDKTAPACDVGAKISTSQLTPSPSPRRAGASHRSSTSGGTRVCHDSAGAVIPCYDPVLGSLGTDGCYYQPIATPPPEDQASLGGAGRGPGGWYDFTCPDMQGTGGGRTWIAGGPPVPGDPAGPSPAVLARQAVSRLSLPSVSIGLSPTGAQLVKVPTWLWVDPASWRARSATAQVPGLSVTATATPSRVVWSTGDRASVTCTGPGTPWRPGTDPAAASPTCGHTYLHGSAGAPGGVFTLTATVSWAVAWAGGGQGATLPGLTTTTTTTVRVAEVAAVVTG